MRPPQSRLGLNSKACLVTVKVWLRLRGSMHTELREKELKIDDLVAHPATTDYNDQMKAGRPQVGEGGTRQEPGLPPLNY